METPNLLQAFKQLDAAVESKQVFEICNFIGGEFKSSSATIPSINPKTKTVWANIPDSNSETVNNAVSAADDAFNTAWSTTTYAERSKILQRIADIVEKHADKFAQYEAMDQGKTIATAKTVDIPRCVHNFRFFASAICHVTEDSTTIKTPDNRTALNYVTRRPLGVAALIIPWNLPLYLLSFKLAPALAAGNTAVIKPSEMTSVSAWLLCHAIVDAGVPSGVVNMVFGTGLTTGQPLIEHPLTRIVSFTGSTLIGRHIAAATCTSSKKVSLEMGGKNACIVFGDADLELAVPTIVRSCFANQGEICLATSRLYVHGSIYTEFMTQFVESTKTWKIGDTQTSMSHIGALVSEAHYNKVVKYAQIAENDSNATVHCGGMKELAELKTDEELKNGYFFPPTIVSGQSRDSPLMTDEIFGPFVCVTKFSDNDDIVAMANDSEYGLSASLWSRDLKTVHETGAKLHAGTVWCNCWLVRDLNMPFGGQKASGVGRESAKDSLEFFTERSTICIAL